MSDPADRPVMRTAAGAAVLLACLMAAACGAGDRSPVPPQVESSAAPTPAVQVRAMGALGFVLTDSAGHTLYYFTEDEPRSGASRCDGACAATWPPVTAASAAVTKPDSLPAALETIQRSDGTLQVTYAGRPLYRFAADGGPGETKGRGVDSWVIATVQLDCDCPY